MSQYIRIYVDEFVGGECVRCAAMLTELEAEDPARIKARLDDIRGQVAAKAQKARLRLKTQKSAPAST